jgi:hypothetical protein
MCPTTGRRRLALLVGALLVAGVSCSGGGGEAADQSARFDGLQGLALDRADLEGPLAVSVQPPGQAARQWAVMTGQEDQSQGIPAPWPCSGLQPVGLPELEDGAAVAAVAAQSPDGWLMRQWLVRPAEPDAYEAGWRAALESCVATLTPGGSIPDRIESPGYGTSFAGPGTVPPDLGAWSPGYGTFTPVEVPVGLGPGAAAYRRSFGTDDPEPADYVLVRTGGVVAIYDRYCYQCESSRAAPAGRLDGRFEAFVQAGTAKVAAGGS